MKHTCASSFSHLSPQSRQDYAAAAAVAHTPGATRPGGAGRGSTRQPLLFALRESPLHNICYRRASSE